MTPIPATEGEPMHRVPIRQGDVILVPIDEVPATAGKTVARDERGWLILAEGEQTGHSHAILDPAAELLSPDGTATISADQAAELYLLVHGTEPVDLLHDEHGTLEVAPGAYEVWPMREYAPEAPRRLLD